MLQSRRGMQDRSIHLQAPLRQPLSSGRGRRGRRRRRTPAAAARDREDPAAKVEGGQRLGIRGGRGPPRSKRFRRSLLRRRGLPLRSLPRQGPRLSLLGTRWLQDLLRAGSRFRRPPLLSQGLLRSVRWWLRIVVNTHTHTKLIATYPPTHLPTLCLLLQRITIQDAYMHAWSTKQKKKKEIAIMCTLIYPNLSKPVTS